MSESTNQIIQAPQEMWAIVELMGHGQTAGRVEKPTEWGGLMRVDVPDEHGGYRTEFYSMSAIYSVKFVSEDIARAFAPRKKDITAYDAPIITREEHHKIVNDYRLERNTLQNQVDELKRRLIAVKGLPAGEPAEKHEEDDLRAYYDE